MTRNVPPAARRGWHRLHRVCHLDVGTRSRGGVGSYAASKAAAALLILQAAIKFAPDGIRINGVAPGSVQTERTNRA